MRVLFALLSLSLVAACGSGHDVSAVPHDADQPATGVIVIEERLGKRVLDAWFSRSLAPESGNVMLWQSGSQHCDSLEKLSLSGPALPLHAVERAGSNWRQTLFAGDTIEITSRAGAVISLHAQRYGDAVLYASDEAWLVTPLPDDSRLWVSGSDDFPAFPSVALAPMTSLVREQPPDGVMVALSAPIVWQVSGDMDDRIELTVTSTVDPVNGAGGQRVRCSLDDSGRFTLPEMVQAVMPDESQAHVTLVRKRETSFWAGEATLTVVQLSYP